MNQIFYKILIFSTIGAVGLSFVAPVLAKNTVNIAEEKSEKAGSRPGLLRDLTAKPGKAAIGSCTLATKSGTTLTCAKDSKTYTILTDSKTQLRRRFWGKATLDEMQTGDILNVIGKWTDDAKTTVAAVLVRDTSVQKRFGVFIGQVTSLMSTGWVMTTHRGTETVTVSSGTKIVNRSGQTITQADVTVGHRVRVRGLWDSKASTITEVAQAKDYNLPVKPTPTS